MPDDLKVKVGDCTYLTNLAGQRLLVRVAAIYGAGYGRVEGVHGAGTSIISLDGLVPASPHDMLADQAE